MIPCIRYPPVLKLSSSTTPTSQSEFGVMPLRRTACSLGSKCYPVAYASRSCTPTEKAYTSIEREALSIVFGCKIFHEYIYGRSFTIFKDHKPLQTIFENTIPDFSRIQRFLYQLQKYHFKLEYSPGPTLVVSDTLSRAPT